ncbi:MAG: GNAT family N-acetyltransferase [Candidatus Hodarchaeota archaeon]
MIHELTTNKDKLRPLINNFKHRPMLESIIEGSSIGKIFVDDLSAPRSAIVWTFEFEGESLFYLLGTSTNTQFNEAFQNYFNTEIKPLAKKKGWEEYYLIPLSEWSESTLKNIFGDKTLIKDTTKYFLLNPEKFRELHSNWKKTIPDGYSLQCIESEDVFKKNQERMPEFADITSWTSYDRFKERGFSYCLVKNETKEIVAGCTTGFVVHGEDPRCELGLITDENFRRRGFATIVSCATIEEALKRNLKVIVEIWNINEASIKTHQKLGFEHFRDGIFYGSLFDELQHYLVTSHHFYVNHNNPQESAKAFNKALEIKARTGQEISATFYYYAACAYAKNKNIDQALKSLVGAVESGLRNPEGFIERLKIEDVFSELRETKMFNEILNRASSLIK